MLNIMIINKIHFALKEIMFIILTTFFVEHLNV